MSEGSMYLGEPFDASRKPLYGKERFFLLQF